MPELVKLNKSLIRETMRETNIPGVSIGFKERGETAETLQIGQTDKHHVNAMTRVNEHTSFAAASLTKPVFAYLTLKLIEQGALSREGESPIEGLDRPLNEIYPFAEFLKEQGKELREEDVERANAISARHCLSHSSGLSIDSSPDLRFTPGEEYAYSGFGLMYLQKVLEVKTGKSLEELGQEFLFRELMPESSFLPPEKPRFMRATESSKAGSKESEKKPNGANSLHTTAIDYTNLMEAWMKDPSPVMQEAFRPQVSLTDDHQVLPGQSEPAAQNVSMSDKSHLAWGLGVGLELDEDDQPKKAFHTGDMNQYRSQMALDLERQSSIVYFANGRDHREANGHVLGPLILSPITPLPHAHNWFYGKFPFASHKDELIGGPNFGLRKNRDEHSEQSYVVMSQCMPEVAEKEQTLSLDEEEISTTNQSLIVVDECPEETSVQEREQSEMGEESSTRFIGKL